MKVTKNWLIKHNACCDGMIFVTEHKLIGTDECQFIRQLVKLDKHDWALWLLVRRLDRKDTMRFAVYCAKDVLPIYEAKHPNDDRPRKAIEAAEACVIANTKKNRDAAWEEEAAARAAKAAAKAAARAAWSARAASRAAWSARAADAAWSAAEAAAEAAAWAQSDERSAMNRYIEYGVGLLEGK